MDKKDDARAAWGLLVLRVTLACFLLLWSIEKLILPEMAMRIARGFYGVQLPAAGSYALGIAELILSLALLFGAYRTISYGLSLLVHSITVLVSYRQLLDPFGFAKIGNHIWISTIPTWGGFVALFMLRAQDSFSVDGWRQSRA